EPIRGSNENPVGPVFSPDGQWIAYTLRRGTLKKIAVSGGTPVPLADLPGESRVTSWHEHDIVFSVTTEKGSALQVVSDSGGTPRTLATLEPGGGTIETPQILADGRHLLYTLRRGRPHEGEIIIQSLGDGQRTKLTDAGARARVLASGQLVYVQQGN